jgi:hypothetical protein
MREVALPGDLPEPQRTVWWATVELAVAEITGSIKLAGVIGVEPELWWLNVWREFNRLAVRRLQLKEPQLVCESDDSDIYQAVLSECRTSPVELRAAITSVRYLLTHMLAAIAEPQIGAVVRVAKLEQLDLEGCTIHEVPAVLDNEVLRTRIYAQLFAGRRDQWMRWGAQVAELLKSFSVHPEYLADQVVILFAQRAEAVCGPAR